MFRRKPPAPVLPPEWLVVGLGNPGPEYSGTRHNVGFETIERLAKKHGIRMDQRKHRSVAGLGTIEGVSVALIRPLTFMNLSGQAVTLWLRHLGLKPEQMVVVADDLDLETGRVRMKPKGSPGGHNGHKSIVQSIGTDQYPRIKIGIGKSDDSSIDHVLGKFHPMERTDIERAIDLAGRGVEVLVSEGLERSLTAVNSAR